MTEIINARFQAGGKEYSFNPNGLTIDSGDAIIVSTTKGPEYAVCTEGNHEVDETTLVAPLRQVLRFATDEDKEEHAQREKEEKSDRAEHKGGGGAAGVVARRTKPKTPEERAKEREALRVCQQKIDQHKLDMRLVSADLSPDGSKVLFYFTAENRVDFRALVKDLAATFHARIELRQIGVRDETKLLGGLGICGQPYCCSRFLDKFQPVSIKMAKTQSLSLNPTKISGACGRLMCCLKYEQGAYEDAVKRCPKKDSFVETPDGVGTVTDVNLLREKVKVHLEDGGELPKLYLNQEIRVVRSGKGKRPEDYVAPPKEELEALRYIPPMAERKTPAEPKSELAEKLDEIFSGTPKRTPTRKPSRAPGGKSKGRGNPQHRRRRSHEEK